ncbi:MAG: lanthionine synthetase LanC family protein [Candidatus Aquirickettsiella gammari]
MVAPVKLKAVEIKPASNPLYLEIANRLGNVLCRDAVWDQARCNWLGWGQEMHGQRLNPVYKACAADLYSGTSGIALFLAELYQFTHDRQQLRTIEAAVNQAWSVYARLPANLQHGFYVGGTGVAFALIRIGELLQRDTLIERGFSILDDLRRIPLDTKNIDVISGSAGAIPALLTLAKKYQREELADFAQLHGRHLLQLAEHGEFGCSWPTIGTAVQANLTGHSHGTAGIATALLELYSVSKETEFFDTAQAALCYERHWFNQGESNWADLRQFAQRGKAELGAITCSMAWCHGAPGIGLSRLRNLQLLSQTSGAETINIGDTSAIEQDLEAALQSSSAALMQPWLPGKLNYSLCHGAAGNAELMIMAAQQLQRPALMDVAEKVAQDGHNFYVKQGLPWPCGNGGAGESPGLMLGTAGIGYFYLRMFDVQKVPSVLLIGGD